MSGQNEWTKGTGQYIGDDHSTYVVTGEDGRAFMVFVLGSTVGRGNTMRRVTRHNSQLVISAYRDIREDVELPEVVLAPGQEGYWESSGRHVFSKTGKVVIQAEPKRKSRAVVGDDDEPVRQDDEPVATIVTAPVAEEPAEATLPPDAKDIVKALLAKYRIRRGPGGILLLFKDDHAYTPSQIAPEFGGYLQSNYRGLLLKTLRYSDGVGELVEIPVHRFTAEGYVADVTGSSPGWYWREPGQEPRFLASRREGARVSLTVSRHQGREMAINNSHSTWKTLVGFTTSHDMVFPRARSNNDFELLVLCPQGAAREFTVLVATDDGLALVSFTISRNTRGGLSFDTAIRDSNRPAYVVATDGKGRHRVFKSR